MRLVILGCGRVGSTLAATMSAGGHEVTIIDRNSEAFDRLGPDFAGRTVIGVGIDEDTLRQAGIEQADAFVAVTNGDNTNIMAVQIVREMFHVPRVLCRIYDPIRAEVYRELGIDTICVTTMAVGVLHDLLLDLPQKPLDHYLHLGRSDPRPE